MRVKNKKLIYMSTMLICSFLLMIIGIFATSNNKSVNITLSMVMNPEIYFAIILQIDAEGDGLAGTETQYCLFNNTNYESKTINDVTYNLEREQWSMLNGTGVILNDESSPLENLGESAKFYLTLINLNEEESYLAINFTNANSEPIKATPEAGVYNISQTTPKQISFEKTALYNQLYTLNIKIEKSSTPWTEIPVYLNLQNTQLTSTKIYSGVDFETTITTTIDNAIVNITELKINGAEVLIDEDYTFNENTGKLRIPKAKITGCVELKAIAIEYWDGTSATTFAGGNGTAESPFLIHNGKQLALMADLVNTQGTATTYDKNGDGISEVAIGTNTESLTFNSAYYKLINNIYLNRGTFDIDPETYEPIISEDATRYQWNYKRIGHGTTANEIFYGVFDGSNNVIEGLYIYSPSAWYAGVFGLCRNGTEIKNLILKNGYIFFSEYTGSIAGRVENGKIINCKNYIDVCINNGYGAGGIVGEIYHSSVVDHCVNYGNIFVNMTEYMGESNFGGIVGGNNSSSVYNCVNYGDIICTSSKVANFGGIAGTNIGQPFSYVKNCVNFGDIYTDGPSVGGVIGINRWDESDTHGYAENVYSIGELSASHATGAVASGNIEGLSVIKNAYAIDKWYNQPNYNICTMDATTGMLANNITIGTSGSAGYYSGNQLSSALNAWVIYENTYNGGDFCMWTNDTFPTLILD